MAGGVGRSRADFNDQVFIEHPLQVPLQAAAVDGRAERLEILNGQLTVLEEIAQCLALSLVQPVLLYQHIPADNLLAALAHLDHLGFQAGNEVVEPTCHVHAVVAHALDRLVEGLPVGYVVVFTDGEQSLEIVPGLVKAEGGEKARGTAVAVQKLSLVMQ